MSARRGVIVTGGGTAGHVLPAIAIAEALVEHGRPREAVRYVGARRGMERRLVPESGFPLTLLPGRGVERRVSRAAFDALVELAAGIVRAVILLGQSPPEVVVSVGGYAGLPASLAALVWSIPLVVVNIDAIPGAANRLAGRFAKASAVALAGTPLPRATLTGAPVRSEVAALRRSATTRERTRRALDIAPDAFVIVVAGGSLGARRLNEAGLALARRWADQDRMLLYHVTGEREHARVLGARPEVEAEKGLDYRVVGYEARLAEVLCAADVAICRAGASTIAELCVIGTPSLLVPLPGAPSDHQRHNAERLQAAGAAWVVADDEATGERLGAMVESLRADPARRAAMEQAALSLGQPDAARRIASLVEEVAQRPRGGLKARPTRRTAGATRQEG